MSRSSASTASQPEPSPGRGWTVAKPGLLNGVRAVDCLFDEIAGRPEHGRVFMPCRLIERGSLADLSLKPAQTRSKLREGVKNDQS
ncbi:hypothetical protein [Ensifer canadensis]